MTRLLPALFFLTSAAHACDGLSVSGSWVREPPPGSTTLAAFMTLTNPGSKPMVITAWRAPDFDTTMLHETVVEGGIARMVMREKLEVPAEGSVALKPGGLHLMLVKPSAPVTAGSRVRLVLSCADGELSFQSPVRRADETP